MRTFWRAAAAVVFALAISTVSGIGHDHATGVVKERMDMMDAIAKNMKAISERIKNKSDLSEIKAEAEAIAGHSPHIIHLFPKGSMQKPTAARAAIWQNWSDFENIARAMEIESGKLAKLNTDDFSALTAQVQAVSQTCSACHTKYRVKKKGD
jgi:cytochrome c556